VDVLGLSYREAARALHVREATITTRLFRARKQVAGRLVPDPDPGPDEPTRPAPEPRSPEPRALGSPQREEKGRSGVLGGRRTS
jgi:hypothetical protein